LVGQEKKATPTRHCSRGINQKTKKESWNECACGKKQAGVLPPF